MDSILITGGAGFIGSNFVHYVMKKYPNYYITVLDALTYAGNIDNLSDLMKNPHFRFYHGDIRAEKVVDNLMRHTDVVVNFAAETHVDRSILEAGEFISTDVQGTFVLLESARKHKIQKFVQISTDEVYGDAISPEGESRPSLETDPLMPRSPYAASKAGADRLAFSYWTTYDLPVIITRCSNNYGPYQYPEKLIPLFVTNAIENKPLPVYGSGENTRDWIYVMDHCSALDIMMHSSEHNGEVFNIGSNKELSVLQITDIVLKTLNKPSTLINHVKDRLGHVKRHAVNTDKIYKTFGWTAKTDFETAIKETVLWYVNNSEWWRRVKEKQKEFQEFYNKYYENR